MQNKVEKELLPPIPPPPPPPPPSRLGLPNPKSNPKLCEIPQDSTPVACKHDHFSVIFKRIGQLYMNTNLNIVSFYKPVQPVIQEGPCCGIVALSMASQFFPNKHKTAEEILATAKLLEFTKSGEMFSAFNMATLASSVIGCEASVISNLSQNSRDILHNICLGYPVLIPYDADKNHEPRLNKGQNAHWAILCGMILFVPDDHSSVLDKFTADNEMSNVYNMASGTETEEILNFASEILILAYQGKSKHFGIWNLNALIQSNNNLVEVTNKYSLDDMIIPSCGLLELNDKAVLLKEKI
ncbi:UPF0692 protein C19orf54 homolog [Trichonephila inaurata madagascariensis]|uniref:Actin maturation protease n=1 Tax=Trichonephila inaurata madagascariensis TaxID=2747483 RepID=A0A8X6I651_9ARAC|nr:UPF0692 protein C19orf54 homolog [Trichonephila inaurata madagascariensis]